MLPTPFTLLAPAALSAVGMRVARLAVLERQDRRILDGPVPNFDGSANGFISVPCGWSGEDRPQMWQQGLADFPSGRVPQVGRAVVHGVVGDAVADHKGGL